MWKVLWNGERMRGMRGREGGGGGCREVHMGYSLKVKNGVFGVVVQNKD